MDIVLVIIAFLFLLVGFVGSVVPVLPGPPLCYLGLLLLQWSGHGGFSFPFLLIMGIVTAAIVVMDNILPAILTKKFGGSKMAVTGSIIGLVIGMIFFAPAGIILGPFFGALIGEIINSKVQGKRANVSYRIIREDGSASGGDEAAIDIDDPNPSVSVDGSKALKAAFGAFLAFIVGTGAKLIIGGFMINYAIRALVFQ